MNRRNFLVLSSAAGAATVFPASQQQAATSTQRNFRTEKFLVGVEYYRAPMPPQEFWDQDFAAIRRSGMRIVRTFSFWNWIEPQPGKYELEDFDHLFELARKHDLLVWFDLTLATHGAAPEWMMRRHPDMRVVSSDGEVALPKAGNAAPQGKQWHCYDHPKWKEYSEAFLRTVVGRYKDSPNLLMWNVWDGVATAAAHYGFPNGCYCQHSLHAYLGWLQQRFTLDQLNQRLHRRYRDWADVEPARSNAALVEAVLWREFQYEDLKEKLRWQVEVVRGIDDKHEIRGHGAHYPRYWDEMTAVEVDSWGFSAPTSNMLTSDDPYRFSTLFFATDWSRSIGRGSRWWYEEIYAGMNPGTMVYKKQTTPEEIAINLWLTLAKGGSGALFWQYRPEYMSFEAPGLNLVSLAGKPLPRLRAAERTIQEMRGLEEHLPLTTPKAETAVVYHDKSDMVHEFGGALETYRDAIRGVYRTLWQHNIPVDVISPQMDWNGYKAVYLPNMVLLDESSVAKIRATVQNPKGPHLIADGLLGTHAPNGRFSYDPPEGLSELLGVKTLDYTRLTGDDIRRGENQLRTENSSFKMTGKCNYVGLDLTGKTRAIAWYGNEVVGMETPGKRFTWFTFSLATALKNPACDQLLLSMMNSFGVEAPVKSQGDRVIIQRTKSRMGGWLLFLFNLEQKSAQIQIEPTWDFSAAEDSIEKTPLRVQAGRFGLSVVAGGVKVVYVH
ncbi:MAG: hypothetical protein EXQ58_00270 [Acidobacteria bacterium]|nr:hypothetical protein [Acidobacteriota bacterium]